MYPKHINQNRFTDKNEHNHKKVRDMSATHGIWTRHTG